MKRYTIHNYDQDSGGREFKRISISFTFDFYHHYSWECALPMSHYVVSLNVMKLSEEKLTHGDINKDGTGDLNYLGQREL